MLQQQQVDFRCERCQMSVAWSFVDDGGDNDVLVVGMCIHLEKILLHHHHQQHQLFLCCNIQHVRSANVE